MIEKTKADDATQGSWLLDIFCTNQNVLDQNSLGSLWSCSCCIREIGIIFFEER